MPAFKKAISLQSSARLAKRVFSLFLLLLITSFLILPSPVYAAEWTKLNTDNYQDEIATQRFTRNILVAGHVAVFGTNPLSGEAYSEKVVPATESGSLSMVSIPGISKGNTDGGALGLTSNAIAYLYSPPTSSAEYLAKLGENIGIAPKEALAQTVSGSGDNVIKPVLALWQVSRNIAYSAFILVFIAAGLMIMFRQKLNPQTVVGIQQALPGLVIGLILVTFSYFIAAFIVDLAFVGTRLMAEIFISTNMTNYYGCSNPLCNNPGDNNKGILETYQNSDAFKMYGSAAVRVSNVSDVFGQVYGTLGPKQANRPDKPWWENVWENIRISPSTMITGPVGVVIDMFSGIFNYNLSQAAGAGIISVLAAILIPLILGIALMIQFIRLIIALLMSYLQILIMVVFGPFLILFSAIPGRGGTLSYWLKSLLANVLVFPAVFAGFLFAGMLLQWNSENLTNAAMPLFGGLSPDILKSLLAFGVLLGLPSVPEMVRSAFGVKGPQGFTQAAIGGFMGGVGGVQTGYSQGMQRTGLRARQEAMEKAQLERAALARPGTGGPSGFWEQILSRMPSGRR